MLTALAHDWLAVAGRMATSPEEEGSADAVSQLSREELVAWTDRAGGEVVFVDD